MVKIHPKVVKALSELPEAVRLAFGHLARELRLGGPAASNWPHYGKLMGKVKGRSDCRHCHLSKGRPTYVSIWREAGDEEKTIEVIYVGTHEKAPY
jgi:hypothetical protein